MGKLSDRVGRGPVLLTAIAVHATSLVSSPPPTESLRCCRDRAVQGLSTGAALGAMGAAMLDMDSELGTLANAITRGIGTATGAIVYAGDPDPA